MKITELQEKILILVVKGKNNNEIATELNYSVDYIKKNISKLFKYYKVANRVELVRETMLVAYGDK